MSKKYFGIIENRWKQTPERTSENSTHCVVADCPGCVGGLSAASLLDYPGQGVGLSASHLSKNTVTENSSGLDYPQSGLRLSTVQKIENRSSKTGYGLDFTAIYGLSVGWQRTVRNLNSKQSSRSPVLGLDSRHVLGSLADCPWVAFQQPKNHLKHKIARFVADSKPTATKFGPKEHEEHQTQSSQTKSRRTQGG